MVIKYNFPFIASDLFLTLIVVVFSKMQKNICVILAFIFVGDKYQKRLICTTFHNVTNLAKDLIFLLKYLYAYKPSQKHNCTTVKVPCSVKVVIPLHIYECAHLSKST